MFTQFAKMLILTTFFPDNDTDLGESWKSTVDLADLVGLYIILGSMTRKRHSKVLTAGIGWPTAEVILSRAFLLWVGTRGAELCWKYIQKCLESNIALVQHISTWTLIWLWTRHDLKNNLKAVVTALLLFFSYKPLLHELLIKFLIMDAWVALLIKELSTIALSGFALIIYGGLAQTIGIS